MNTSSGTDPMRIVMRTYRFELDTAEGTWCLWLPGLSAPVLSAPDTLMLVPLFAGAQAQVGEAKPPVVRDLPAGGREVVLRGKVLSLSKLLTDRWGEAIEMKGSTFGLLRSRTCNSTV